MNSLTQRVTVGLALSAASVGFYGGAVEAQAVGDGNADIRAELPDYMRDQAIHAGVLKCEISPIVQKSLGDNAVRIVQSELAEEGYGRGGIDNKLGRQTCKEIHQFQDDKGLFVDGIVGKQVAGSLGIDISGKRSESNDSRRRIPKSSEKKYSVEDCSNYKGLTVDTIKALQKALGVYVDGDFGDVTCNAVINMQTAKDIAKYGQGSVGPKTASALGVTLIKKSQANNADFSPAEDCPRPTSCDIIVDLTTQRLRVVDNSGGILWNIPVQSGKKGFETRAGSGKLGPVEYGPGKNPERKSRDYPEATLVNPRGFGNGGQKIHGSYSFNGYTVEFPESGSAGCIRVWNDNSYIIAQMPTGTDVDVSGKKPGTQQRYF